MGDGFYVGDSMLVMVMGSMLVMGFMLVILCW